MKKSQCLVLVLFMVLPVMVFTASCAKKAVQTQVAPAPEPEIQNTADRGVEEDDQARKEQEEDRLRAEAGAREAAEKAFVRENVHFAFDSHILSDQARQVLTGKAAYLRTNSHITVTVEGHCDERGTYEYNLALGQRRAESVKKYLVDLGINMDRLNTISYGEERPVATGRDEESWAKNRRAQFVVN